MYLSMTREPSKGTSVEAQTVMFTVIIIVIVTSYPWHVQEPIFFRVPRGETAADIFIKAAIWAYWGGRSLAMSSGREAGVYVWLEWLMKTASLFFRSMRMDISGVMLAKRSVPIHCSCISSL